MCLKWVIVYAVVCCTYHRYGFILALQAKTNKTQLLFTEPDERLRLNTPGNTFLFQQGTGNVGSQTYYYFGENNENTIIDKMEAYNVNIDTELAKNQTSNRKSLADRWLNRSLQQYPYKNSNTTLFQYNLPNNKIDHADSQINPQATTVKTGNLSSSQPGEIENKNRDNYIISLNAGSAPVDNLSRIEKEALQNQIDEMKESIRTLMHEVRVSVAAAISENLQTAKKRSLENKSEDESVEDESVEDETLTAKKPIFSSAVKSFFILKNATIIPPVNLNWPNLFDYTFNQYEQRITTTAHYVKSHPDFRSFFKKIKDVLEGYALDRTRFTVVEIFVERGEEEFLNTTLAKYSEYKEFLEYMYGRLIFIMRPVSQSYNTRLIPAKRVTPYTAASQPNNNDAASDYLTRNRGGTL